MNDFREQLYTVTKEGRRKWVYSSEVSGTIFNRRRAVACVLLLIYVLMPWLVVNGQQAVFLDIAARKFTVLGATFWATDTQFLALLLIGLALCLFFFSAVFGRVWCGWACPETVFLEFVFRPIEALIEGNSAARQRLDKQPWNAEKIRVKALKYFIFATIAWFLASTLLAYFVGREKLIEMMSHAPTQNLGTFLLTLFLMGLVLFQFGWFREQFCTVLCPYARFQSVLLDKNSLIVGYDTKRGEPRGKVLRDASIESKTQGDCVDCGLCVRVCPTGIDIRNGQQLECIHCAACVDACDSIMEKVGRPAGLIRYDTEMGLQGQKVTFIRPRIVVYAALILVVSFTFFTSLTHRQLNEFQVMRGSGDAPFSEISPGHISNHLHVHISNKSGKHVSYTFSLMNEPEMKIITPLVPFQVKPGEEGVAQIFIEFNKAQLNHGEHTVTVSVNADGEPIGEQKLKVLGPG